jgi:hypothetical protein
VTRILLIALLSYRSNILLRIIPLAKDRIEPNFSKEPDTIARSSRDDSSAKRPAIAAGLVDEKPRRRAPRYVFFGASLAILAGGVILATSFGVATFVPDNEPALEPANASVEPGSVLTGVRQVGLPASVEVPSSGDAPPIPRPRPESITASIEPSPAASPTPDAPAPILARAINPAPVPQPEAVPVAVPSAPDDIDSLLANIEKVLAKPAPSPASADPVLDIPVMGANTLPPVLAAPVALESSVAATTPPYPVTGSGYPSYEGVVLAPPATIDNRYSLEPSGPIPPEPIPYAYPAT